MTVALYDKWKRELFDSLDFVSILKDLANIIFEYSLPVEYVPQKYAYGQDKVTNIAALGDKLYILADGKIIIRKTYSLEKLYIFNKRSSLCLFDIAVVDHYVCVLVNQKNKSQLYLLDHNCERVKEFDINEKWNKIISVKETNENEFLCLSDGEFSNVIIHKLELGDTLKNAIDAKFCGFTQIDDGRYYQEKFVNQVHKRQFFGKIYTKDVTENKEIMYQTERAGDNIILVKDNVIEVHEVRKIENQMD